MSSCIATTPDLCRGTSINAYRSAKRLKDKDVERVSAPPLHRQCSFEVLALKISPSPFKALPASPNVAPTHQVLVQSLWEDLVEYWARVSSRPLVNQGTPSQQCVVVGVRMLERHTIFMYYALTVAFTSSHVWLTMAHFWKWCKSYFSLKM
jgi:hypothetical protein